MNRLLALSLLALAAAGAAPYSPIAPEPPQALGPAGGAAADPAAAQALKDKGLTRIGAQYLVDEDVHLRDGLKTVRMAKKQVDDNAYKRAQIEAQIRDAEKKMAVLNQRLLDVNARMTQTPEGSVRRNTLAAENNMIIAARSEGRQFIENKEKELAALPNPIDEYVTALMDLSDKMETAVKKYADLSADADVKAALAKLNDTTRTKVSLGPSAQFNAELPSIRKQREAVNSAVIKLEFEGGVPHVNVTLDGKVTEPFVVDSGAAVMTLTHEVGAKLGFKPGPGDAVATLVTANGAHVKAAVTHIKTVRLGQFTVNDVEAAIMPDGVGGDNLLGGSFLRHFVYRMDLGAKELHLSQIGGKPAAVAAAGRKPGAAGPATAPAVDAAPPAAEPAAGAGASLEHIVGNTENKQDGAIVIKGKDRIYTDQPFTPPVTFRVVAKTDSTNLRFSYGIRSIILNWENNPSDLRLDGIPGKQRGQHKPDAGQIPVNQWVTVELAVTPDSYAVSVDGQERMRVSGNFSRVNDPLTIYTAQGATIAVKSVEIVKK